MCLSGFVQAGDMALAEEYFSLAPDKNDVVLRTTMISGYMSLDNSRIFEVFCWPFFIFFNFTLDKQ